MEGRTLAGSVAAHTAVLVGLFAVFPSARARVPATLDVHLLSGTPARSQPQVAPEPEKPTAQLEPEKTPNRPTDEVIKIPKKTKEPSKPAREKPMENTTGAATVGSSGLSAEVGVDDANFEFTYYLIALRNKIGQNWSAAGSAAPAGQPVRAVVYFRIKRDGGVAEARVEQSSGIAFFDQSALRAVMISSPVPPLPLGFTGPTLGVHFAFEFTRQ
jgi:TonB family protein